MGKGEALDHHNFGDLLEDCCFSGKVVQEFLGGLLVGEKGSLAGTFESFEEVVDDIGY
jgi:hypothetical protein